MIPLRQSQAVKGLVRTSQLARILAVPVLRTATRFQSTSIDTETKSTNEAPKVVPSKIKGDRSKNSKNNRGPYKPSNRKLREIVSQIFATVDSISTSNDVIPAIEILEEGLSYLREIQAVEGIEEGSLYSSFQPVISKLFVKASEISPNDSNKSLEDLLDTLIQYKVAHGKHFTEIIAYNLKNVKSPELMVQAYGDVLRIWVKYIEYSAELGHQLNEKVYHFMFLERYFKDNIKHLVYFSYIMSCLKANAEYDSQVAKKLLQTEELSSIYDVQAALSKYKLTDSLEADIQVFKKNLDDLNLKSLDPNGPYVLSQLKTFVYRKDNTNLRNLYSQVKNASVSNNIPITELTISNIMNGFYTNYSFDDVFRLFQDLISNGVENPSQATWDVVLRSMSHMNNLSRFNDAKRKDIYNNFESTLNTALKKGYRVDAKGLCTIINGYANFNKFDKVDELLEQYKDVPVIQAAKNGIINALILNGKLNLAEEKFLEFDRDGSNYKPSSTVMNSFISVYAKKDDLKAVENIMSYMRTNDVAQDIATYTTLLDYYFKSYRKRGLVPDIDVLFKEIGIDSDFLDNEISLAALVDGLSRDGLKLETARQVYAFASEKSKRLRENPHILTSLVRAEITHGIIGKGEILFDRLIKSHNTTRTWNNIIVGLLNRDDTLALQYYQRLKEQTQINPNIKPNKFTLYYLLWHYMQKNDSTMIQHFIDEISAVGLNDLGKDLPKLLSRLKGDYKIDESLLNRRE